MTSRYPHLFSPIRIGPHELPNRILMGSMHTGLEEREGGIPRLAAFYAARAAAGCALMVTGGFSINDAGRLGPGAAMMATAEDAQSHRPIPEAVHGKGGRILLQLLHAGRYGYHDNIVAPSAIRAPINRITPRAMTEAEILTTIQDYANAASRARDAGYDGVEIMGSEGYLLNEFTALRTNHREDDWGGSFENRARLPLAVIEAIRAATGPSFVVMYRLSVLDIVEGGSPLEEVRELAARVQEAGADIVNSGIGWHEARTPTIAQAVPRGGFAWATRQVRDVLDIPIVATNRFNMPDEAEAALADGDADMISMARPFLSDEAFVDKARTGRPETINTCIACNQACLDHYFANKVSSCLVNPRACHETLLTWTAAANRKTVAVVGAGPAGLAAAEVAAMRGHRVTLLEASDRIGGQFALAAKIPGKQEFNETLRYFDRRIGDLGITLWLNKNANADILADFDEIILATGVVPRIPDIEGIDGDSVMTYAELLSGRRTPGERVALIGAGGIGVDVALYLAEIDSQAHLDAAAFRRTWLSVGEDRHAAPRHRVTLLQRGTGKMGMGPGRTTGWVHRLSLQRSGVEMIGGITYRRINETGLWLDDAEGNSRVIQADSVVLCAGQESVAELVPPLRDMGKSIHVVGGAKIASEVDAKRAIQEGVSAAAAI